MNKNDYTINLLLKDNNISVKVKNLQVNFNSLHKSVSEVNTSIKSVSTVIGNVTNNINKKLEKVNFSAIVNKVKSFSDALKTLSGPGVSFEQSMANLSSQTGIVGANLDALAESARQVGKETGIGATAAADAFASLASQIDVNKVGLEALQLLQKETITLAQATGLDMAQAASIMTSSINEFGLNATDANRIINVLAAGSKEGAASVADLSESFKATGSVAAAAGLSIEQSAAALEVLSQSNLKGAEAGNALRDILLTMQTTLGLDPGETGLSVALDSLKPKLSDVSWLAKTFGDENLAAAQYLISNASAVDAMTTALTGTNVAQDQAAIRANTTAEQMKQIQAVIDDVKIGFFNLTGGIGTYVAALGDSAVMVSQLMPLFGLLKSGVTMLASANTRAALATTAKMVAEKTALAVTSLLTGAQAALNAVMSANPIALIVIAIGALVAGLVAAYQQFDGFRKVVDTAWTGITQLASAIWDSLVKAFTKLSEVLSPLWNQLKTLLGIHDEVSASTTQTTTATTNLGEASVTAGDAIQQLTSTLVGQNTVLNTNLSTIGGIEQKLSDLKTAQKSAMTDQAIALEKEIRLWEKKKEAMQNAISIGAAEEPEMKEIGAGNMPDLSIPNPKINSKGGLIIPVKVAEEDLQKAADKAKAGLQSIVGQKDMFASMQQGLGGMASLMQNLSGVVGESAGAWLTWGGSLLQSIAQAIPQIIALTNTQVTSAITQVTANTAVAGSGAVASVASIPIVGWIMAGAAMASIMATLASLPKPTKMANGGIAYGTALAMIGEYPGAANNPEVIAPLSKLRQLIQPAGANGGIYEFRLRGRDFVAVAAKHNNINERTR